MTEYNIKYRNSINFLISMGFVECEGNQYRELNSIDSFCGYYSTMNFKEAIEVARKKLDYCNLMNSLSLKELNNE